MLTFNLKKEWFDKIKNGEKTHEYRETKPYWIKRLRKYRSFNGYSGNETIILKPLEDKILFCCGYPKNSEKEKYLKAKIKTISIINGLKTDLKIDAPVFDIEFELINKNN